MHAPHRGYIMALCTSCGYPIERVRSEAGLKTCRDCAPTEKAKVVCGGLVTVKSTKRYTPSATPKPKRKKRDSRTYTVRATRDGSTSRSFDDLEQAIQYREELLRRYTSVIVEFQCGGVRGILPPQAWQRMGIC